MNEKIERLKTSKQADILAPNAARLGEPELAKAARTRGVELRASERPVRKNKAGSGMGSRTVSARKIEGECLSTTTQLTEVTYQADIVEW